MIRRAAHQARHSGAFWMTMPSVMFLGLVFLPAPPGWSTAHLVAVVGLCVVLGAQYLISLGLRPEPLRTQVLWLLGIAAVFALLVALIGVHALFLVFYVVVPPAMMLPWPIARVVLGVLVSIWITVAFLTASWLPLMLTAMAASAGYAIAWSIHRSDLEERLAQAEQRNAVLAVAAERERIGRDLHDILGHSLTTITVTAQLAGRLVEVDPASARGQLDEIERTARQCLSDVRATASGMRQVRVASELASSRSVLGAADIEADLPVALPVLDDQRAELFGYVVREAVTNVVRHSRARRCTITVTEHQVQVRDDGIGLGAVSDGGAGLHGLRSRLEAAGGRLVLEHSRPGTALTATLGAEAR